MHTHICRDCRHTWRHKVPNEATTAEYEQAHMCPACGKGPWRVRYTSAEEALASLNSPDQQPDIEADELLLKLLFELLLPINERRMHR